MRNCGLLLGALLLAATASAAPALAGLATDDPATAAVEAARQATVTVRLPGPDGEEIAIGAGFIDAATGRIVTNAHVVDGFDRVEVGLLDGRIIGAAVVARDPGNDVALLSADLPGMVGLRFADTPVHVGHIVYAVGSPFGLGQTVTRGIVSALDRFIDATTPYGMIQHDAPLNPGSSGGPVIDARGEVIGINTAMPDGFRRDVGIAYAIPADVAARVVARLAAGAPIAERKLGVSLRALSPRLASAVGILPDAGVIVEAVTGGSAAAAAGFAPADVIAAIGETPIAELHDVAMALDRADPNSPLAVHIYRGTERLTLTLPPAAMVPANLPAGTKAASKARQWFDAGKLGVTLDGDNAATVVAVGRASPAAAAGVVAGDTIMAVGRTRVASARQAERLIGAVITEPFALLLADPDGTTRYAVVDPWAPGLDADGLGGNMRHPKSASF